MSTVGANKAFHNDQKIKDKYIARVKAHQIADEIIKGMYWQGGKGCAVGCTVHSSSHRDYETELGIPHWVARLEDRLFEGMSNADAKVFPLKFLEAIPLGVDLDQAKAPFMIFLLETVLGDFDNKKYPKQVSAIKNVITLYKENCTDIEKWHKARDAAADAAIAYPGAYAGAAVAYAGADAAIAYPGAYAGAYAGAAGAYAGAYAGAAVAYAGVAYAGAADAAIAYPGAAYAYAAAAAIAYPGAVHHKRYKLLADKLLEIFEALEDGE